MRGRWLGGRGALLPRASLRWGVPSRRREGDVDFQARWFDKLTTNLLGDEPIGEGAHKGRPYKRQGLVRGAWQASWVPAFAGMTEGGGVLTAGGGFSLTRAARDLSRWER